jgi:hypothetical protein
MLDNPARDLNPESPDVSSQSAHNAKANRASIDESWPGFEPVISG